MDIRKWHNKYSIDCRMKYNSLATQHNYITQVKSFLSYFKDEVEPKAIPTEKIKLWLLEAKTINTRKHRLCAINSFYALSVGMPDKVSKIPYPKADKKLPIVLSTIEMQRLFAACTNLKHRAIMVLMYGCGLRISEVLNLKPEHIDSQRMIINIIQAKGKKDRQVMLPEKLLVLLRQYFKQYKPKGFMFNGQNDAPQYSENSINQFVKAYAQKAGIRSKRIYAHLFRHTSFTHMMEAGTDINLIQKLAGHNSVKTTMMYCHVSSNLISNIPSPLSSVI